MPDPETDHILVTVSAPAVEADAPIRVVIRPAPAGPPGQSITSTIITLADYLALPVEDQLDPKKFWVTPKVS
jgi:hypothetical protein